MQLVVLVLVLASLVAMVFIAFSGQATSTHRLDLARRRVKAATDLAYAHDELSPHLADAIIAVTRGLGEDQSVQTLEAAIDEILALAREHRAEEPELAVIVIDELRREEPRELG